MIMKPSTRFTKIFLCLFIANSLVSQNFDSLGYAEILDTIASLDTSKYSDFLNSITKDTTCIKANLEEINAQKVVLENVSKITKTYDDAIDNLANYENSLDTCYSNLKNKFLKELFPISFKTPQFIALDTFLKKVDKDNSLGKRLEIIESEFLEEIEELSNNQIEPVDPEELTLWEKIKNNWNKYLLPIILLIGLITAISGFILTSMKLRKLQSNFNAENIQKNNQIYTLQSEIQKLKMNKNLSGKGDTEEINNLTSSLIPTNISPAFFAETFVSAGPRKLYSDDKSEGDIDLGEDIAGFLVGGNYSAFWVLDGTSGQDRLNHIEDRIKLGERGDEYFSSRLLAQNIAWNLHSLIKKYGLSNSSFKLLKEAIKLTQIEWQQKIDDLSEIESNELKSILEERNMLMCSTTIVFGILGMNRELDVTISGDCTIATHPKQIDLVKNNRRQSANLYMENNKVKVDFNEITKENSVVINESNIEKVVAMSDGISKTTQKWIASNANIDVTNPQIRESLSRLKQKTQDDKSITIIQIM